MTSNENLFEELLQIQDSFTYELSLVEKIYPLKKASLKKFFTPVDKPTTRGGVYQSDTFAYKIKGTVEDLSVIPLLSETMLGPNTEFREIEVRVKKTGMDNPFVTLFTNLTSSMQSNSRIELDMTIVRLEGV